VNPSITIRNAIVNENMATATTLKTSLARKVMISSFVDAALLYHSTFRSLEHGLCRGLYGSLKRLRKQGVGTGAATLPERSSLNIFRPDLKSAQVGVRTGAVYDGHRA
jgi:hypothetical protein